MDTKIIDELEEAYSEELTLVAGDLGALEQAVRAKMQQLGKGLLQRLVQRQPNGYKGSSIFCNCGGSKRFVGHRAKDINTIFGWIKIQRAYYHCRDCGAGLVPYDIDSGLGHGQLSPGLAKACCLLAVDDSFEQTSRKIEEVFGQKVSPNTIDRLTHQVGTVLLQQADQELTDFQKNRYIPRAQITPKRLYIAVDGTTVHETDGWHEAKIGVIYWEDEHQEGKSYYVGGFDNSETFGWHFWSQACRCGLREADEVILLGDGAPWIRTEHHRHFGRATFIIDWYHACQHVWYCGKALFGEGAESTEKWVKKRLDWLWDGWTKRLLDDLQEQRKKHRGSKREAIDALIHYISVNEGQMCYDVFREEGYDIGSGAVEGACKYVVGKRLKQSGMIWNRIGSSSILALRITWLNKQWERLWSRKPLAA